MLYKLTHRDHNSRCVADAFACTSKAAPQTLPQAYASSKFRSLPPVHLASSIPIGLTIPLFRDGFAYLFHILSHVSASSGSHLTNIILRETRYTYLSFRCHCWETTFIVLRFTNHFRREFNRHGASRILIEV